MASKEELQAEAAFILEQEGWQLSRWARDTGSARLRRFAERYEAWQAKVKALRKSGAQEWPEPPDNS